MKKTLMAMALACASATGWAGDYEDGFEAYQDGNYRMTFQKLKPFAERGDVNAQILLGALHLYGQGVIQDYQQAVRWFRLAAAQGDDVAQYNLGQLYREGEGVVLDAQEAVRWFRLSAKKGNFKSQNNLGMMYADGLGVSKNLTKAHAWFNMAASQGDDLAAENRANVASEMTLQQIEQAQRWAKQCMANNYKGCD